MKDHLLYVQHLSKRMQLRSLCKKKKNYLVEEGIVYANSLNVNVVLFYFPDLIVLCRLLLTHPNQFEKLVKFHFSIKMID